MDLTRETVGLLREFRGKKGVPMTNLGEVLQFVLTEAGEDDLTRIFQAGRERSRTLGSLRAASVGVGDTVTTTNLSPKILSGITGRVTSIKGTRATLAVKASDVPFRARGRFGNSGEPDTLTLSGVPLSALKKGAA